MLVAQHYYGPTCTLPMQRTKANDITVTVPAALTYPGLLRYWIVIKSINGNSNTFPGTQPRKIADIGTSLKNVGAMQTIFWGIGPVADFISLPNNAGNPLAWDFDAAAHYEVPLVAATAPLPLFQAATDRGHVEAQGLRQSAWIDYPTTASGNLALRLVVSPPKPDQPTPPAGPAAALRTYLGDKLAGRPNDLANFKALVIKAQTNQPAATQLRVLLVTKDAAAYAATVPLTATLGEVRVPLSALQPALLLLTPRPYPGFLPLTFGPATRPPFRLAEVEVLQLVLERPSGLAEPLHVDIESVVVQ